MSLDQEVGRAAKLTSVRRMNGRLVKFFWKSIPKNRCMMSK